MTEQVNRYMRTMLQIARLFGASRPSAIDVAARRDWDARPNPLIQWNRALLDVKRQAKASDPQDGLAAASALLSSLQTSGASGPGFLSARAKVCGLQAELLVKLGRDEGGANFDRGGARRLRTSGRRSRC